MTETFRMTKQHLQLLSNALVRWDDSPQAGAPCIDPVRPYGGQGAMSAAAHVLGLTTEVRPIRNQFGDHIGSDTVLPPNDAQRCWKLHRETEWALQIVLQHQAFEPGLYARHGSRWERIA